jgi:hypothetical protein
MLVPLLLIGFQPQDDIELPTVHDGGVEAQHA